MSSTRGLANGGIQLRIDLAWVNIRPVQARAILYHFDLELPAGAETYSGERFAHCFLFLFWVYSPLDNGSSMPAELEHQIVLILTDVLQTIGWGGVAFIMALESANIPIPSEVTMPLAGWLLVQAQGGSLLQAFLLGGFFGALGCTIGSIASYALGAYGGRPFLDRYGKYFMISHHDLALADGWFTRWGNAVAFFSRLLPIVRTFISFPMGVSRTPIVPFVIYTFAGSFIWCGALALGGYAFGANWEELRAIMRPFDIPIAIILVGGFIFYVIHHVRRGRSEASEPNLAGSQISPASEPTVSPNNPNSPK